MKKAEMKRCTYTLDAETLKMINDIAKRNACSKSQAVRLAVRVVRDEWEKRK